MPDQLMDPDDTRPIYVRIADELRKAYEPGTQLATPAKIAAKWGVAKATAERAIDLLRSEGLVVAWQGRGTFYRAQPEPSATDDDAVILRRLDEIMTRLDDFDGRLAALESLRGRKASE
ncbi:GntR family transcriptional regulator [Nocardia sp. CA-135398]|uniref:GntR family transcriptional regulator n=1 Tax=Nocardia sp. CA-135398 TaxID=3239977 RepID=UPI003D99BCEB